MTTRVPGRVCTGIPPPSKGPERLSSLFLTVLRGSLPSSNGPERLYTSLGYTGRLYTTLGYTQGGMLHTYGHIGRHATHLRAHKETYTYQQGPGRLLTTVLRVLGGY